MVAFCLQLTEGQLQEYLCSAREAAFRAEKLDATGCLSDQSSYRDVSASLLVRLLRPLSLLELPSGAALDDERLTSVNNSAN